MTRACFRPVPTLVLACALALGAAGCPKRGGPLLVGLSEPSYLGLFLEKGDLPPTMRMVQDTRRKGPDRGDREFARHQGVSAGFAVWMDRPSAVLWRLVDVRWVFPTEQLARAYLERTRDHHGERNPRLLKARSVGHGCRVYGGTVKHPLGVSVTHFFYVFREGNVVVKLYGAQGPAGAGLVPDILAGVGRRIVARIRASQP